MATEVDLRGRKHGTLWLSSSAAGFAPSASSSAAAVQGGDAGLLATIYHTKRATASTLHAHRHRITHACFDAKGSQLLTADHRGDIFWFKLDDNCYKLVYNNGTPLTAIAIAPSINRILIADADNWIRCIELSTGSVIEQWGDETQSTVHRIDINQDETYAVVTCANEALLFQLNPLQHLRNLNGAENVGVQEVLFTPSGSFLVTAFKDDTIMLWSAVNLQFEARLPIPTTEGRLALRCFAVSRDSKHLLAGGKCRCVFLYNIPTESLVKAIELPESSRGAQTIHFLWAGAADTKLLMCGVLGHDGVIRFLDVNSAQILSSVGPQEFPFCDNFSIDPNARYLALVRATGELGLYDLVQLLRHTAKVARSKAKSKTKRKKPHKQRASGFRSHRRTAPSSTTGGTSVGRATTTTGTSVSGASSSHLTRSAASIRSRHTDRRQTRSGPQAHQQESASAEHLERYLQSLPREGVPILHDAMDRPAINFLKLRRVLLGFGEYPTKYRKYIWKRVLNLPNNVLAYNALNSLGTHPAFARLQEHYPLRSRKLQRILQRTMSCLAHWAPIFGELPYLAGTVFPFVRMFQNNPLEAFEVCATVLTNWCQLWFEFFPNPPLSVLNMLENLLAEHDVEVLQHFVELGMTAQGYGWPLLQTMFSDVFAEPEWLRVWDNVVSNHPGFIMYIALAYLKASRAALLTCATQEDVSFYLSKPNPVDADEVVKLAYELASITTEDVDTYNLMHDFKPLTPGTYPVFNEYPEFVVDYQVREREKIREEEATLLRERALLQTSEREIRALTAEEEAWKRQEQMLLDAEASRRSQLQEDLARLDAEKRELEKLKRDQRLRHQKVYEQSRREFLTRRHRLRDMETKRMEDEAAVARALNRSHGRTPEHPAESVQSKLRRKYSRQRNAPSSPPSSTTRRDRRHARSHESGHRAVQPGYEDEYTPLELAKLRTAWQDNMSASSVHDDDASTHAPSSHGIEPPHSRSERSHRHHQRARDGARRVQPTARGHHTNDNDDDDDDGDGDDTPYRPRRHVSDQVFETPLNRVRAARGKVLEHQRKEMSDKMSAAHNSS
ncbi:hypothetical protein PTSG_01324 [Salpingoeca rosetta]|uniref:TBC1 domain family member 31 n=1 Tax=Salpingoeca rosetta (strain ATCC 50818 / BSB-021) TaxID=946362 RepID=F2U006_SALR5|nr:uncharacterized protein PTSG_01324 [Salpingoeca rosetta]EGD80734.1 hypothetical protein PTSG_01324 [Salpingoeca rosetta]|eukprot:XP_004997295.1 hypothetical protein PTSG_01324 [Salpingoeca rosetta]